MKPTLTLRLFLFLAAPVLAKAPDAAAAAAAIECPAAPQQTAPMVTREVSKISRTLMGPTQTRQRIQTSTRNLYADYPNAGEMVVRLTGIYVACQIIRNSTMTPAAATRMLADYQRQMMAVTPSPTRQTAPPARPQQTARPPVRPRGPPPFDPARDPSWAAGAMSQAQAEAAVTMADAREKPWCVPSFPDRSDVVLAGRDRFLYLRAAQDAISRTGRVRITGFSFEIGMSSAYGARVTERKARAVADVLVELKIPEDKLDVDWVGANGVIEPIGSRYCGVTIM